MECFIDFTDVPRNEYRPFAKQLTKQKYFSKKSGAVYFFRFNNEMEMGMFCQVMERTFKLAKYDYHKIYKL